jgi:hypothetical protein
MILSRLQAKAHLAESFYHTRIRSAEPRMLASLAAKHQESYSLHRGELFSDLLV